MKAKPSVLELKSARGLMLVASLLINSADSFASTIESYAFVHLGSLIKCLIVNWANLPALDGTGDARGFKWAAKRRCE